MIGCRFPVLVRWILKGTLKLNFAKGANRRCEVANKPYQHRCVYMRCGISVKPVHTVSLSVTGIPLIPLNVDVLALRLPYLHRYSSIYPNKVSKILHRKQKARIYGGSRMSCRSSSETINAVA